MCILNPTFLVLKFLNLIQRKYDIVLIMCMPAKMSNTFFFHGRCWWRKWNKNDHLSVAKSNFRSTFALASNVCKTTHNKLGWLNGRYVYFKLDHCRKRVLSMCFKFCQLELCMCPLGSTMMHLKVPTPHLADSHFKAYKKGLLTN